MREAVGAPPVNRGRELVNSWKKLRGLMRWLEKPRACGIEDRIVVLVYREGTLNALAERHG